MALLTLLTVFDRPSKIKFEVVFSKMAAPLDGESRCESDGAKGELRISQSSTTGQPTMKTQAGMLNPFFSAIRMLHPDVSQISV